MPRTPPDRCLWIPGCRLRLVPINHPGPLELGTALHGGRGLCRTHHKYAKDRGELDQYPRLTWSREEILTRWAARCSAGNDPDDIAKLAAELGLTYRRVRAALVHAGVKLVAPRSRRRKEPKPRRVRATPPPKPPPPPRPLRPSLAWSKPGLFDPDTCDEGE